MAEMLHEILINAASSQIYHAISTAEGLKGWWTADVQAQAQVGSIAHFGFAGRATVFRMRIESLVENQEVQWYCLGDADEWEGTQLYFQIESTTPAQCVLHFKHANWRSTKGWFAMCNTTWGALMVRLKEFAEGKHTEPYFDGLPQR